MKISKMVKRDFVSLGRDLFEPFREASIVITGATGLIGSLVARYLLLANAAYDLNVSICVLVRDADKARNLLEAYDANGDVHCLVCDLQSGQIPEGIDSCDYIVHTAAITSSKIMVTKPVDTIVTSFEGTRALLELAHRTGARMVYLSSMEVYGNIDKRGKTSESDLGFIDIRSVRSGYPESKRLCECLCTSYAEQYGVGVAIARLAQTFGAGILPTENRVFAQFARSALAGENIVLKTRGLSEGNYVYAADAVAALLLLLAKGIAGEVYNVCNEASHTTIRGMAELVSQTLSQGKSKIVLELDEEGASGYAPDVRLFLSSEKLRNLGWVPTADLREAYRRLGEFLREQKN
ncbi:NAD-dependent epimerase/dehydratase family protein [Thermophilibacter immobilis]|uniref:NAD-dependent epimerase/dehydratase family protein n=1 Tax=Thermophilibacter immobilis TaxID=2779519 RepID=A0A7S7RUK0_9ACTN|nr:NAD-dependent epimerase/dehydratase family protein [Thermophilibacter immobilis]QOY60349.1 NAD-dependent epimerase/dehydratase family protein [Thermophilibacter immobilis]